MTDAELLVALQNISPEWFAQQCDEYTIAPGWAVAEAIKRTIAALSDNPETDLNRLLP